MTLQNTSLLSTVVLFPSVRNGTYVLSPLNVISIPKGRPTGGLLYVFSAKDFPDLYCGVIPEKEENLVLLVLMALARILNLHFFEAAIFNHSVFARVIEDF